MKLVADEVVERVKVDACINNVCGSEIPIGWGCGRGPGKNLSALFHSNPANDQNGEDDGDEQPCRSQNVFNFFQNSLAHAQLPADLFIRGSPLPVSIQEGLAGFCSMLSYSSSRRSYSGLLSPRVLDISSHFVL